MVNEKLLSLSVEIIILILITKTRYFRKKQEISCLNSEKSAHSVHFSIRLNICFFLKCTLDLATHRFQKENMSLLYWIQTSVLATRVNQEAADKAHCRRPQQQRSTAQCTQVTGSAIKYGILAKRISERTLWC